VAGTSAGAPQWAAIVAIANQGRAAAQLGPLSTLPAEIYRLPGADFHDVASGSNGFSAGPGYDLVTGRGTPLVQRVVPDLVTAGARTSFAVWAAPTVLLAAPATATNTAATVSRPATVSAVANPQPAVAAAARVVPPASNVQPIARLARTNVRTADTGSVVVGLTEPLSGARLLRQ
jgi:hypothetical protein